MAGRLTSNGALSEPRSGESKGISCTPCPHPPDDAIVVSMPWVYILRCADNSLYVGLSNDVEKREQSHNDGFASSYTAKRRPVRVVYRESLRSLKVARARERQLKRWTVAKKEALIAGDRIALKRFSRCRRSGRVVSTNSAQSIVRRGTPWLDLPLEIERQLLAKEENGARSDLFSR